MHETLLERNLFIMKLKSKKGFTIVELVIVIGVIGILSAILIPTFVNVTENAKKAALQSNLSNAYSSYVSEAGDGIYDNVFADDQGAQLAIAQKGKDEVYLAFGSGTYQFNGEKWVAAELPTSPVAAQLVTANAEHYYVRNSEDTAYVEDTNLTRQSLSTFNKAIVYYVPAE